MAGRWGHWLATVFPVFFFFPGAPGSWHCHFSSPLLCLCACVSTNGLDTGACWEGWARHGTRSGDMLVDVDVSIIGSFTLGTLVV